jgi:hypothetical protein
MIEFKEELFVRISYQREQLIDQCVYEYNLKIVENLLNHYRSYHFEKSMKSFQMYYHTIQEVIMIKIQDRIIV